VVELFNVVGLSKFNNSLKKGIERMSVTLTSIGIKKTIRYVAPVVVLGITK